MKVVLEEEPRVFRVKIGNMEIGTVTSYAEKGVVDEEAYHAERLTPNEDERNESLGWFATLEEAGTEVVEYEYGPCKFGKPKERIV